MFSISSSNKQVIRIKDHDILIGSPYKDTILIYGNPLENDQIPLNGTINFIIDVDYLIIKKISLRLIGQYKLEFIQISTKSCHNNSLNNLSNISSSSSSSSLLSNTTTTTTTTTLTTNTASTTANPSGSTLTTNNTIESNGNDGMNITNGVAVVKENSVIFECLWNNLLINENGEIITNITKDDDTTSATNSNTNNIKLPYSRFKLKRNNSNHNNNSNSNSNSNNNTYSSGSSIIIDITPDTINTLNIPELIQSKTKVRYKFHRGKYSIPFKVMLPNNIPETIEGLQSGSILYTLESNIDCKHTNDFSNRSTSLINLNLNLNGYSHNNNKATDNNREDDNVAKAYNPILSQYHRYKYLRILRTLSSNNLNIDEEVSIQNTLPNRLQYEIKIPSRAIPIGDSVPIQIKIFPFSKHIKLIKISVYLSQKYYIKDLKGTIYDNEIIIFKKSIKEFGSLLLEDNKLFKEIDFISKIGLPKDLKSLTQSCSIRDEKFVQVLHRLKFQLKFKRYDTNVKQWKNFQINATIPLILYISPYVNIKGRLVYYDQMTGKIHFRPGELIDLFNSESNQVRIPHSNNLRSSQDYFPLFENIHDQQQQQHLLNNVSPPPTYEEYNRDQLIIPDHHLTNELSRMLITDNIPSYEQATSSNRKTNP